MKNEYAYPGQELAFFEKAVNWKSYFASHIKPFIGKQVLEVGSGIGGTTVLLNDGSATKWMMIEPDEEMRNILKQKMATLPQFANCSLHRQTIFELDLKNAFDTIIYIDVLEHIKEDKQEMAQAARLLKSGGYLVILSPAFSYLYSPFDKAIGHYRRYTAATLKSAIPSELQSVQIKYLDSAGFFASLANKLLLRQNYPSQKQVSMWDKWMVPISRTTDKIFFHSFGKSILGIWRKP